MISHNLVQPCNIFWITLMLFRKKLLAVNVNGLAKSLKRQMSLLIVVVLLYNSGTNVFLSLKVIKIVNPENTVMHVSLESNNHQ